MAQVRDMHGCSLDLRMAGEIGADQLAIPRPVVLSIARRMDADEPAAGADIPLERCLLLRVENIPGRAQEDDSLISREYAIGEGGCILGGVDRKSVFGTEGPDRRDPVW